MRRLIKRFLIWATIGITVLFFAFPPLWMVLSSFKTQMDILQQSPKWIFIPTFDNYIDIFSHQWGGGQIVTTLLPNSIIVALASTVLTVMVSLLAAYGLSRYRFKGRKLIGFFFIVTRMLPPIGMVMPLFLFVFDIGLLNTRTSLVLVYSALNVPLAVWMLKGFVDTVPMAIDEAAMIDGCSRLRIVFQLLIPIIGPGLAVSAIFAFTLAWNEFTIALFLTQRETRTLPLMITAFQTDQGLFWGPMTATGVIILLPVVIFTVFSQKHMVKGLTLGAVK